MELLQGGTRRLTGETDNLALGYQTTADGFFVSKSLPLETWKAGLRDLAQRYPPGGHVKQALHAAVGAIEEQNVKGDHHPPITKKIEPVNQESAKENVRQDFRHARELVRHMKLAPGDPLKLQITTRLTGALYTKRHPSAQVDDAAVDAVVQAFNNVNLGEGPNKVNRESIRSDLAEGAKIGNDPRNRSDLLLVKGVTGSLGAEGSRAWTNYFLYDAAKSANTHPVGQQP